MNNWVHGHHCLFYGEVESFRRDIITMGNYVVLADQAVIINHCPISFYEGAEPKINIGDNVYIGKKAIVLPGADIGSNTIIGAGAVVAGPIPPYSVVVGNPGRQVRQLTEREAQRMKRLTAQTIGGTGQEPNWEVECE